MTSITSDSRIKRTDSSIDLTPMLDVVFILLIFFVVTASFLKEDALPIHGQEAMDNPRDISESQDLLLQIAENDVVYLNGQKIEIGAVKARISQIKASNPSVSLIVRPSPNSKANNLVSILNAAREAGVLGVSVIE